MPDRVKPSRMLVRLDAEIAAAATPLAADCKRAERAAYLSRLGRFSEARAELDALHHRYDLRSNVLISSWLNLVEGLVSHFSEMDSAARDKILRCHALSTAANLTSLQALSAAWLAHMDYLQVNVASMARHVMESLRMSSKCEHATRSRVSLVVAQAYHVADRLDLALPWYGRSRDHALAEGDEATVSALMHNMAWLRAQQLRTSGWRLAEPPRDEEHALLSAESTANFDRLIGSISLQALVPVLRAQVLTARGQYAEALSLYESNLQAAVREGMARLQADLVADQAWCRVQLGQRQAALADALTAEACIDADGQFDDRFMAHGRLAQVFSAIGDAENANRHRTLASEAWSGHSALQSHILEVFGTSQMLEICEPEINLGFQSQPIIDAPEA